MLGFYAGLCAGVLARAHCKTGQGAMLCGYIGNGEVFADAVTKFAVKYADQTEKDYEDFMKSIRSGKLKIEEVKEK